MRIAIVGATGNVGTALLRTLQSAGGHQLTGIARRVPPMQAPYSGVIWHRIDISRSEAAARLEDVFSGIDCVVNLAWAFQPARDIDYLRRIGVGGLAAVLTAAGSAGVPNLVHMSSVGTYSAAPRGRVVDESWPTAGIPELAYSVHKAAAEALLDRHDATGTGPAVCRLRPGLVMQREAGSALLRYGLPALFPAVALDLVPFLPLDRTFAVPVVHAHDVGSAVAAAVVRRAVGAFNLSTATPLTPEVLGAALGARPVHVPWKLLRAAVSIGWNLRLERLDPGWIDLAFSVPLINSDRARTELDWHPVVDTRTAIREAVVGMRNALSTSSAPLRARSVAAELQTLVRSGPITRRPLP